MNQHIRNSVSKRPAGERSGRVSSPTTADQVTQTWEPGALACLAVLDGAPAADAVAYVRQHYSPDAVETLEQASFVADFR